MSEFDIKEVYRSAATKHYQNRDSGKVVKKVKYTIEIAACIVVVFVLLSIFVFG